MGLSSTPQTIAVLCMLTLSQTSSVLCASQHEHGTQQLSSNNGRNSNVASSNNNNQKSDEQVSDHDFDRDITAVARTSQSVSTIVLLDELMLNQQQQQHAAQLLELIRVQPSSLETWVCGHFPIFFGGHICSAAGTRSPSSANTEGQQVGHVCILQPFSATNGSDRPAGTQPWRGMCANDFPTHMHNKV